MLYLIGQIVFCLLLAAIFGFIFGWYLRGKSFSKVQVKAENELSTESLAAEAVKSKVKTVPQKIKTKSEGLRKTTKEVPAKKDNLKRIGGIGPVLEKRLNRLGIERFDQIARFTRQDIDKFSSQIGAFPDRIERDQWVKQAKKLQEK